MLSRDSFHKLMYILLSFIICFVISFLWNYETLPICNKELKFRILEQQKDINYLENEIKNKEEEKPK